jgi:hypothetical protein
MGRTLVLDLSDREYLAVEQAARAEGQTTEEWAAGRVAGFLYAPDANRSLESFSPEVQSAMCDLALRLGGTPEAYAQRLWNQIAPRPRVRPDPAAREAASARLEHHAGAINTGDPRSADNDAIDADLAREYAGDRRERRPPG